MQALVDTPGGRRMLAIRGPGSAQRAADLLFERNLQVVGGLPPVYRSGVRYRRERDMPRRLRRPYEVWQDAARCLEVGFADCEDFSAWRAAELAASGVDPYARPFVYAPRRGLLHVIVSRGDGGVEDPSAIMGMKKRKVNGVKYRFRGESGLCSAGLEVPFAGESVSVTGRGATRGEALADALGKLVSFLRGSGALEVGAGGTMDLGTSDLTEGGKGFGTGSPGLAGGGFGSGGLMGGSSSSGGGINPLQFLGQGVQDITSRFLPGGSGGGGGKSGGGAPQNGGNVQGGGGGSDAIKAALSGGGAGGRSNGGLALAGGGGVPGGPPIVAPSLVDKLDVIRDLAEMSRSGDLRQLQRVVRRGGPVGRLARQLLRGIA